MLDRMDRKILDILQKDCTMPVAEIGKQIGLSTTPCWRRIQKLEESGIIQRRVALLDAKKVNVGVTVFVSITTSHHTQEWLVVIETNTFTPTLTFLASSTATRRWITPDSSSFWMRRQQGVVESPIALPISATGIVQSFCRMSRILRSILSNMETTGFLRKKAKIDSMFCALA